MGTINCRWRVGVEGGAKVRLYYWDTDSWEYITINGGGTFPSGKTTDVTNYFNDDILILLAVGGTKPGDTYAICDVCKLDD